MSLFTQVISKIPKLHSFDLSFENLLTMEFGDLVPVACYEILPRDKVRMRTEALVKTTPMLAPIYSRIDMYLHYFYVPNRLLQSDWEEFITTGKDGLSTDVPPVHIQLQDIIYNSSSDHSKIENGSLADYLNLPPITNDEAIASQIMQMPINALPFLAYNKIYIDWFQDELLDNLEFYPQKGRITDGGTIQFLLSLQKRSWKKDYFTSARPTAQLGVPIQIPGTGEVVSNGTFKFFYTSAITSSNGYASGNLTQEQVEGGYLNEVVLGQASRPVEYGEGLELDSIGIDVNDLRRALRLQQWQEKNMRGGNRYIENIYHHFGQKSSDARLQRSQFLGARKVPVVINEVTQTSSFPSQPTALGQLAGKGTSVGSTQYITFNAEEHGLIIVLASIMPKPSYFQGLSRMWTRNDYLDYAWPLFGNLGEQEVFNREIYLASSHPDGTFGYQSRYAEYKFQTNQIHSAFRSSMDYWHNARKFSSAPVLNSDFVHLKDAESVEMNRIFASVQNGYGHFLCDIYHDIKVLRALPRYGIPSI